MATVEELEKRIGDLEDMRRSSGCRPSIGIPSMPKTGMA